jgi:hypothetical protein
MQFRERNVTNYSSIVHLFFCSTDFLTRVQEIKIKAEDINRRPPAKQNAYLN